MHLLVNKSFTTREVSFENRAEELDDALTLLANFEKSETGIPHILFCFLIFRTSKWYYFDSVWACVSHAAACHDNHQVEFAQRHLLFCLVMLQNESFNFQKMFGLCLFPYSQHICSMLTQMDCFITVCISRRLNACVVKSRMFSSSGRTLTSHPSMLTNTSFIVEGSLHELLFHALKHLLKV